MEQWSRRPGNVNLAQRKRYYFRSTLCELTKIIVPQSHQKCSCLFLLIAERDVFGFDEQGSQLLYAVSEADLEESLSFKMSFFRK